MPRATRGVVSIVALALMTSLAGCVSRDDGTVSEQALADRLLDDALDASNASEFSTALGRLGPVGAERIDALMRLADSGPIHRRVNATKLLSLAREPKRRSEALAHVARSSDRIEPWAVALDALFRDDRAAARAIASERSDFVSRALEGDGDVLRAGIRAAMVTKDPALERVLEARLADPEAKTRGAVVDALLGGDDWSRFESQLRQRLSSERVPDVAGRMAALLSHSTDAAVRHEVMEHFWSTSTDIRNSIADELRKNLSPWVRDYFVGVAREGGERRSRAMAILADSAGDELLPACVDVYEKSPKRGEAGFVSATLDQEPCNRIISRLAGRPLEGDAALAFARSRLGPSSGGDT